MTKSLTGNYPVWHVYLNMLVPPIFLTMTSFKLPNMCMSCQCLKRRCKPLGVFFSEIKIIIFQLPGSCNILFSMTVGIVICYLINYHFVLCVWNLKAEASKNCQQFKVSTKAFMNTFCMAKIFHFTKKQNKKKKNHMSAINIAAC